MTEEHPKVTRIAAYAVCVNDDGSLLLCRIAPGFTSDADGRWTLPGGGLEHGEDPRDGALRELAEETGYTGELGELLAVDSWARRLLDRNGVEVDYHAIRIIYRCRIVGGDLRVERDGSTDDARWFGPGELHDLPIVDLVRVALDRIGVA